ncbi:unnamed protein product, partial [Mesorhabditis spiculigera]
MTNLLPDDSYCTSQMGKYLFRAKADCPCTVTLISTMDETVLGVTYTAYTLEFKFMPMESLLSEPKTFRITTRYKEVNKLQAALAKLHKQLYLRGAFPNFPQPKLFGKADEAAVEERKRAILQVFEFVVDSEVLRKARVLHEFVQKASEIVDAAPTIITQPRVTPTSTTQIDDIFEAPVSGPSSDPTDVLEPIRVDETEDPSSTATSSSQATYHTPPDSPTDEFQFPDLPLTFNAQTERDPAPSAIRRFLHRVPLKAPFAAQMERGGEEPSGAYLLRAGQLVSTGQRAENEREWELAFHCYKQAIHTMIQGLQEEKDVALRNAVRRKTAKYLVKAERIYRTHLSYDGTQFNFEALYAATVQDPNIMAFQCSNSQLKNYRVRGVSPGADFEKRVLIVEELHTGLPFAMKLVEKGAETPGAHCFLATHVPHMVQLHKYFQTEA